MKKIVIVDGYQTCIKPKRGLTESMKMAYLEIKNIDIPSFDVFNSEYKSVCIRCAKSRDIDKLILLDDIDSFSETFRSLNLDIPIKIIRKFAQRKWIIFKEGTELYPDVVDILKKLREKYILVLCINGVSKYEFPIIEYLGLNNKFDRIIIMDMIGKSKALPSSWSDILELFNCSINDVEFILDDQPESIAAASEIGLNTVRIRRGKYAEFNNKIQPNIEVNSLNEFMLKIKKVNKNDKEK